MNEFQWIVSGIYIRDMILGVRKFIWRIETVQKDVSKQNIKTYFQTVVVTKNMIKMSEPDIYQKSTIHGKPLDVLADFKGSVFLSWRTVRVKLCGGLRMWD